MDKALIVEDDPGFTRIFAKILNEYTPYKCHDISDNLESALKNTRMTQYGLYLCDGDFPLTPTERMHEGAFFLFYEELCRIYPKPNIVLASINENNLKKAHAMGVYCYHKGNGFVEMEGLVARLKVAPNVSGSTIF